VIIGVARETAPGERRVALVPDALAKLTAAGVEIVVEKGAGVGALIPDSAYEAAGAKVVSRDELYKSADVVLRVQKPSDDETGSCAKARRSSGCCSRCSIRS
jgi:NAD(P) transhydrogenase subunit alpha